MRVTDAPLALLQFPYSHYNEKARWALDWKRIPHRRVSLLPGPHALRIRRLTGGETTTPVLLAGRRVVAGSAAIVEELERMQPEPALFPRDPALRERALAIARRFDDEVGPRVRRALFAVLLGDGDYFCRIWSHHRSAPVRALYRATFPFARPAVRRNVGLDAPGALEDALDGARRALDFVAETSAATGQLAGDRFTVADLTAAALLAPLTELDHPDMDRPRPAPPAVAAFYAQFASHPGIAWVHAQYRAHRPPCCAVA
jgi:glutathione S-transferase